MADRKGIILYFADIPQWKMLTKEQAGELVLALLEYGKDGAPFDAENGMLKMAFSFIASQIDRDGEKYKKRCDRNAENGKKGGRPKKANGSEETEREEEKQSVIEETQETEETGIR